MKSIKTKLILYFTILILASSITIGAISLNSANKTLTIEAEETLASLALEGAKVAQSRVETQREILTTIANRADIQTMDWNLQQEVLKTQVKNTTFLDIAAVQPDGTAFYPDGSTSELGDREYIKRAFNGESNVSDLLISRVTNSAVLMFAAPIENNDKVVGVLIGRADGNALSNIIDDMGYRENGYAYMLNKEGTIVAHPERDLVLNQFNPIEAAKKDESLKSQGALIEKIIQERTGVREFDADGHTHVAGYAAIEDSDWSIVIVADKDEVLAAIPPLIRNNVITTIIIIFISFVITYFIGNSITRPILRIVEHSHQIADLDISHNVPDSDIRLKDEIGDIANAFQSITSNLRNVINEINQSSQQVAAASEELMATSGQSATTAEEVTKTVEEIAKGASEQAISTEEGARKANLLGDCIEENQGYMTNLNTVAEKVSQEVNKGLHEIEHLYSITEENNLAAREIFEVIQRTNESSNSIGEASSVITTIAEQTNLLALNAAIEAARAGDAGKGFAVVAEEIRKLAEQSSISSKSIDEIVSGLQQNVQNAVKTMDRVSVISKEQTTSVQNSKNRYMAIEQAMKDAIMAVQKLNVSGEEMEILKKEILDTLQNLTAIAEENAAATQQASASMEEQTASIQEIAGASESLANLSQDMQLIISKFKV